MKYFGSPRSKNTSGWLVGWLAVSCLISLLLISLGGVNLRLSKIPSNLQSGVLSDQSAHLSSDFTDFAVTFSLASGPKNQLQTSIEYPEIYELQIKQIQLLTPFGKPFIDFKLKQKTQLIELLKIDRNRWLPLAVSLTPPAQPSVASVLWLALGKTIGVFTACGLLMWALAWLSHCYRRYIYHGELRTPSDAKILLALMVLCGVWSLLRGQDFNWDLQNYHYYNPFALLNNRYFIDIEPVGIHSYFSPLLDVWAYLLLHWLPMQVTAFILGACSGLFAFGVYKIIRLIYATDPCLRAIAQKKPAVYRASIFLSLLIAISGFANATQLGTTMNENFVAIPIIWAYYYLLRYKLEQRASLLYLGGLLMGVAVGLKLTAVTFALSYVLSFALIEYKQLVSRRFIFLNLALLGGFFMINGWWMWKMYHVFHNPFFPSLGGIDPYTAVKFQRDTTFIPKDWLHWLFMPFYLVLPSHLTSEQSVADPRLAIFFCLLAWCACYRRQLFGNQLLQLLLANCLLGYLFWLLLFSIQRYAIPIEALAAILIFVMVNYLAADRFASDRMLSDRLVYGHKVILILAIVIFASTKWGNFNHLSYRQKFSDLGSSNLPHDSLVIFGGYPLAYLAPLFGTSNVYMNRPDSETSEYNSRRKREAVLRFIRNQAPIYLVDKNPQEMQLNSQGWLSSYHLRIASCISLDNATRQQVCRLEVN